MVAYKDVESIFEASMGALIAKGDQLQKMADELYEPSMKLGPDSLECKRYWKYRRNADKHFEAVTMLRSVLRKIGHKVEAR